MTIEMFFKELLDKKYLTFSQKDIDKIGYPQSYKFQQVSYLEGVRLHLYNGGDYYKIMLVNKNNTSFAVYLYNLKGMGETNVYLKISVL